MNGVALNSLFKPYTLEFQDVNSLFEDKIDEQVFMDILIDIECSKSANETCANADCNFNFIHLHDNDLYKQIINGD